MERYDHQKIEKKWQKLWQDKNLFKTPDKSKKEKFYILDMFPYPSGLGLHVGHPKGYIATDIIARTKRMQGLEVLHPMGWDAFGLPAENHAIKNKVHPAEAVQKNIATYKRQLSIIGLNYDWSREINTTDPEYYKWTQWIFLQLFRKGLAYESDEPINWCPSCKTGIANEDLEQGVCEQCGSEVEQKPMRQWVLKITDYAERLLAGLDKLDWEDSIKEMQRNWIGKSEGALIKFQITNNKSKIINSKQFIEVFTTRPDTLFGATYMVLASEHEVIENYKLQIINYKEVHEYIHESQKKTEIERLDATKAKTGVELKGIKVINPATKEEIPVWIADYVLATYGTGAIMAVPAHDKRDWEFAHKFSLPIIEVVKGGDIKKEAYIGAGISINSGQFDGLEIQEAKKKIIHWLDKGGHGKVAVNYKLRDWVFSRQRYWGEPIPLIHCGKCGVVPVPEEDLPVRLPEVESYEPTGTGESPLANIDEWVNVDCPKCGGQGRRETNTMPQWAGSSWYYLRYVDPTNSQAIVDKKKEKYWSPVDFYVGGAEHATRHLIYARFWHKFLYDIGVVSCDEPFAKLQHVGLILAEDGRKMSKRWNNVVNPDEIVEVYGADSLRLYEMFMGPFAQSAVWDTHSIAGVRKFLDRIWRFREKVEAGFKDSREVIKVLHQTIKKVTLDIEQMRFNTAIAQMMVLSNLLEKQEKIPQDVFEKFVLILSPFAPHLCEELWEQLGHKDSLVFEPWPEYDSKLVKEEEIELVVQVNGKVRDKLKVAVDISETQAKQLALESDKVQKFLDGKEPKKVVFVQNKLVNIVV